MARQAIAGEGSRWPPLWRCKSFTGHQQTLAYSLLLAAAYAIVMWRASRVARNWYLWSLLLLAAGVVLAAVQILPTYELMRNSLRVSSSFDILQLVLATASLPVDVLRALTSWAAVMAHFSARPT